MAYAFPILPSSLSSLLSTSLSTPPLASNVLQQEFSRLRSEECQGLGGESGETGSGVGYFLTEMNYQMTIRGVISLNRRISSSF